MGKVTAIKNGEPKDFEQATWDALPEGKYGWQLAAEEPDEIRQLRALHEQQASNQNQPLEPTTPPEPEAATTHIEKHTPQEEMADVKQAQAMAPMPPKTITEKDAKADTQ